MKGRERKGEGGMVDQQGERGALEKPSKQKPSPGKREPLYTFFFLFL